MANEIIIMALLAGSIAVALLMLARRVGEPEETPAARVNALLPQTQCAQCGYPGCLPYAEAIVAGAANINQCAPGGEATVTALAHLLGRNPTGLNPAYGATKAPSAAVIDESLCIGCALCIEACPVDAIVGAAKYTHTVITDECTGCELCLPPCPVNCIQLVPLQVSHR